MIAPEQPDLFSVSGVEPPQPRPKEPTAGDLVAAWCESWSVAHDGLQPHPSVVKRVAGLCKSVTKDCAELDDWRDAWRACKAAGARGSYDIVGALAAPSAQASGRGNHFLAIAHEAMSVAGVVPQIGTGT